MQRVGTRTHSGVVPGVFSDAVSPDRAHVFVGSGLRAMRQVTWSRVAWRPILARVRLLGAASGVSAERAQLAAISADASWSALIAGSAGSVAAASAFRALIRTMAMRSSSVARASDLFR